MQFRIGQRFEHRAPIPPKCSLLIPQIDHRPIVIAIFPLEMPPERFHPFDFPVQRILVDMETHLPPWMALVSQSNESASARLGSEITALADLISPTAKERLVRRDIIDRLELQVRKIWPNATVVPIGSYAQELYTSSRYLPHLDLVDVVIWIYLWIYQICRNLWRI